jgi:tetratricopeptide (TPR) repeat protein
MRIRLAAFALCLFVSLLAMGQAVPTEMTNSDVISMTKAGIGEQTIILAIQHGPAKFDASPQALIALKGAGVSDQVLNAILVSANSKVQTSVEAKNSSAATINDPSELNAYHAATTLGDPKAKASGLESFLQIYPQSVAKKAALDTLVNTYQQLGETDKTLSAATRLLQIDPNNLKAIYISVFIKKSQCAKTSDQQTCDDAAALAQKGLLAVKPAGVSDGDWKKQTDTTAPFFHSAIAVDDMVAKKDPAAAVEEYRKELMMYPPQATTSGPALGDTLQLALAYVKLQPVDAQASSGKAGQDYVQAIWFFARAWNFAPANFKSEIETQLEYYYKQYHGGLDGLDEIKVQSSEKTFPPETLDIKPVQRTTQTASQGLTLKVLQEQSVPYTQESGGGISTTCNIVGTANTSASVNVYGNSAYGNATTNSDQHMSCNSYDTTIRWPHVLNVMFAQGSDGNSYIIACDAAWRWSKCVPLRAGEVFNARFTEKGIEVQAVNTKGKEENPSYHILQSKSWR